ncbi:hypothetical protein GDO78_022381 [Eleutherodactylus coqui]|uniref:Dynein assembly factor 3 C-terminal domain-containing protein n=1 Tax=Eleutherodactylus coqui TaxID=57060 RepID=A0A8J6BI75_ELECQ|nr:hypothetical protein GDO78_022381 [Eleutherodactylus coqui]
MGMKRKAHVTFHPMILLAKPLSNKRMNPINKLKEMQIMKNVEKLQVRRGGSDLVKNQDCITLVSTEYVLFHFLDYLQIDNVVIHFLPHSWVNDLHRRSKFLNLFNIVYFSCSMVHHLTPNYQLFTARKATLIVELTKFMVDLHVDKIKSYVTIVTKVAKEAGFAATENTDWKRDHIATFERVDDSEENKGL